MSAGAAPKPGSPASSEPNSRPGARRAVFGAIFGPLGRSIAFGLAWIRDTLAHLIIRVRVPPNVVTLLGPLGLALIFIPLSLGDQRLAGWVVLLGGAFDSLDGAVARISGGVTRFGAYLDSVVDRYGDLVLQFGLLMYVLNHVEPESRVLYIVVWCVGTAGAVVTSYARARAETLVPRCDIGFMERPERTVSVLIGLISWNVHIALWVLAIWTNLIAAQRILYARALLNGARPAPGFRFWTYRRGSAEHAAQAALIIALLVFGHLLVPRPI